MKSTFCTFAASVIAFTPITVSGQSAAYADSAQWARYQPGTLTGIVRQNAPAWLEGLPAKGTVFAVGAPSPTRAEVVFLGETRRMPTAHTQFIGGRLRARQLDSASVLAQYTREVLVREGSHRYWLPVQDETWANTQELWVPNHQIVLLVQLVGARIVDRVPDWVFLVMTVEPAS